MNFDFLKFKKFVILIIFVAISLFLKSLTLLFGSNNVFLDLKLPFEEGEKWIVTQGYHGSYSHNKGGNIYALDFSLPGEQDYGKPILAAADGVAYTKEQIK